MALTQCTEEEILPVNEQSVAEELTATAANVASLSISGLYTEFASGEVDCKACDVIVDEKATVVDGELMKIKPGSLVCLKKAVRYPAIDFVNLVGTSDRPIIIAYTSN